MEKIQICIHLPNVGGFTLRRSVPQKICNKFRDELIMSVYKSQKFQTESRSLEHVIYTFGVNYPVHLSFEFRDVNDHPENPLALTVANTDSQTFSTTASGNAVFECKLLLLHAKKKFHEILQNLRNWTVRFFHIEAGFEQTAGALKTDLQFKGHLSMCRACDEYFSALATFGQLYMTL
uniref:Uncharacterized protein n=1 Tax=Glossina pallidipes TaxID=7398 RepID=A0A1A9ZU96_GLOPL